MKKMATLLTFLVLLVLTLLRHASAQWEPTNGPLSHTPNISSFVALGSDYLAYANTTDKSLSGLFRSTDKGLTWNYLSSPHMQGLLFANGSTLLSYEYRSGLFRSTDKGMTWEPSNYVGRTITCFCALQGYLYAGTYYGGVYRSSDDGQSWSGGSLSTYVVSLVAQKGFIFAGTDGEGIYRSSDLGNSWQYIFNVGGHSEWNLCTSGTTLFAIARDYAKNNIAYVYRSTDDGNTWTQSIAVPNSWGGEQKIGAVDGAVVIGLAAVGVLRSTDNGSTWVAADSGLTNFWVNQCTSSGRDLFLLSAHGLFRSTDLGARWSLLGIPLGQATINAIAAHGANVYAGSTSAELFRSTDNGATWKILNTSWPITLPTPPELRQRDPYVSSIALAGGRIFFAMHRSGVFSSPDDGVTWTESNTGLTDHEIRALYVSGSTLFAGSFHGGAFRSTDYGEHWVSVNVGITDTMVLAFARDRQGPSLFAGTANKGVFVSTNDGETWRPVDGVLSNTTVRSLFVDGGFLLAGCGDAEWDSQENGGLFRSTDHGGSWVLSDAISRTVGVGGISIDSSGQLLAMALGKAGVYYSTNAGMRWFDCNMGLPGRNSLGIAFGDSFAFSAGTTVGGVYRRPTFPLSLFTSVEQSPASVPASFSLSQNYPNPFNPTTRIKYTVGGAGEVGAGGSGLGTREAGSGVSGLGARKTMLVVYDLLGREVAVLVNEAKVPGSYEVNFDAAGLASGVYIYRLQGQGQVLSRKMILVR